MCANFQPASARALAALGAAPPEAAVAEAYPGSVAPILRRDAAGGGLECLPAGFGLMPYWGKPELFRSTYNARVETVATKPSFRDAWRARRFCWIPADAIFEPSYETGRAVRWRIAHADGTPLLIAGLWEARGPAGREQWSFSMLTINADDHPLMRRFHPPRDEKRSVVLLDEAGRDRWLDARSEDEARALLLPYPAERLTATAAPLPNQTGGTADLFG